MKKQGPWNDLIVLVADKDMEQSMVGLLAREKSLGIRKIEYAIYTHPGRDGGCRTQCHEFLRSFCNRAGHALVMFDREGSGKDDQDPEKVEKQIEDLLSRNGWGNRAAVIILDPELEAWIWSDSREVDRVCGWMDSPGDLRQWLRGEGLLKSGDVKPDRPKEAFRAALRKVKRPPSAALFLRLAEKVSLNRCSDRSFQKFATLLRFWFPHR